MRACSIGAGWSSATASGSGKARRLSLAQGAEEQYEDDERREHARALGRAAAFLLGAAHRLTAEFHSQPVARGIPRGVDQPVSMVPSSETAEASE